jgi:hypothetical protein
MLKSVKLNSAGIAMGFGLDGWGTIPGRGKLFFFFHKVQTGSGSYPASCLVGDREDLSSM